MGYSRTTIHGRLTANPETRQTQSGKEVCSFTVAVERDYAAQGEQRQSDFYNCVVWGGAAGVIAKYFSKGSEIVCGGRMQSRRYTNREGAQVQTWDLNVSDFDFCGSKNSNGNNQNNNSAPAKQAPRNDGFIPVDDDADIPFGG